MTTSSICTRSIAAVIALSFAGLAAPSASAQTTATTIPVGFITKTAPAAVDASTPSNTPVSIPLYQTADFQSAVASTPAAGSHDITLTGALFTPTTQFSVTPHLIRVKTGTLTGKFWLILSNSANGVSTKEPNGGTLGVADGDLTGLVAGDSCEILPANTLGTVFGSTTPIAGLGTGTTAGGALVDNILIWNGVTLTFDTYFYHSGNSRWQKGISNATNTVLYPDDSVFIVRKGASPLPFTTMGTVPSTVERTELFGASSNFVSNRFPVDLTLGTSGIENTPGWVKNTTAGASDTVLLWNAVTGSWDTYFFHSGNNRWQKGISNSTNVQIGAAAGFFIVRLAGTSNAILSQNLPYTP